jgi:hypothetical protein
LIASSPVSIIKWIGKEWAAQLEAKLGVRTVGDLAEWPPYLAAKDILAAKNGEDPEAVEDPEAPSDLIPATGRFPTERVQYEVVLLDKVISGSQGNRASKPLEAGFTPIDFSLQPDTGFSRPALGAVLTYTQSWYTLGLSLGHLLHTVALAPGETTRIAIIDWNRQQKTSVSEDTTETDSLSAQLEHTRAISEITKAVATEAQTGFSQNKSEAETHSFGSGTGVAGNINQFFGTAGASTGITSGKTQSTSFASSSGRREVNAEMAQNICDRTSRPPTPSVIAALPQSGKYLKAKVKKSAPGRLQTLTICMPCRPVLRNSPALPDFGGTEQGDPVPFPANEGIGLHKARIDQPLWSGAGFSSPDAGNPKRHYGIDGYQGRPE